MEANHSIKIIIRMATQVIEMAQAHLVSTQAVLEITESVQLTVLPKITKLICSIWLIKGKLQTVIRTTINK